MKIHVSEDADIVAAAREGLRANDGFCPCVKDSKDKEEYRCLCLDFRKNVPVGGTCHCGLYVKDEN